MTQFSVAILTVLYLASYIHLDNEIIDTYSEL